MLHFAFIRKILYFYPRPPGGGRQQSARVLHSDHHFYPRPPGGGRQFLPCLFHAVRQFLSTPSGWRATASLLSKICPELISIHALRVEGDHADVVNWFVDMHFYPRPPGGGRPGLPAGRKSRRQISIHALRVEGDGQQWVCDEIDLKFLSTPSGWRATPDLYIMQRGGWDFYPRPPGGGRLDLREPTTAPEIFLSTPSGWRAT